MKSVPCQIHQQSVRVLIQFLPINCRLAVEMLLILTFVQFLFLLELHDLLEVLLLEMFLFGLLRAFSIQFLLEGSNESVAIHESSFIRVIRLHRAHVALLFAFGIHHLGRMTKIQSHFHDNFF